VPENFLGVMGMPINAEGEIESENLTLAARNAVLNMMSLLQERGFSREQAYVICSVAVDLRISNVVDVPNYVVSALLPERRSGFLLLSRRKHRKVVAAFIKFGKDDHGRVIGPNSVQIQEAGTFIHRFRGPSHSKRSHERGQRLQTNPLSRGPRLRRPFLAGRRRDRFALPARHAIPTMYPLREFAVAGGARPRRRGHRMRRRTFIAGFAGSAAWPVVARTQQSERVRLIAVLSEFSEAQMQPLVQAFRDQWHGRRRRRRPWGHASQ
jgi:Acetamidase/Formamidase family